MIGKLMRKDLLLSWTMPLWVAGSIAANFLIWTIDGGRSGSILSFGSFVAAFLPIMISGREDRMRTNAFSCALPVSRRQIVAARYLLCLVMAPVWMLFCVLLIWAGSGFRLPPEMLEPAAYAVALAVQVLAVSILLPLMMRFGFIGFLYGLIAVQVLGLLVLVIGPRVGLRSGILAIEDAVRSIGPGLRALRARLGDAPWLAAVLGTVGTVVALSYAVSRALFGSRDL